tara:strand:+ start:1815 stop:2336 length:522 start_codon:yes stop_codon:yes gene_type:complete
MAYPKITVNTGKALEVIASDTIPIPSPNAVQITGDATSAVTNKLVDSGAPFGNVVVGDIVYNTTDDTVATVTAVDSASTLSLSADIFAVGEVYIVFQGGPRFEQRIESSTGCLLYVGTNNVSTLNVDIKVKTIAGSVVQFKGFPVGEYLPVQVVQLFANGTTDVSDNNCVAIW